MRRRLLVTGKRFRTHCSLDAVRKHASSHRFGVDLKKRAKRPAIHPSIRSGSRVHPESGDGLHPPDFNNPGPARRVRCANDAETFACDGGTSPQRVRIRGGAFNTTVRPNAAANVAITDSVGATSGAFGHTLWPPSATSQVRKRC